MEFIKEKQYMEILVTVVNTETTLDRVKGLVSKMNDFEFRPDTESSRVAYQEYRNQLREAFNRLKYESFEDWNEANHYIQENLKILSIW
jgi:hypothetical protein